MTGPSITFCRDHELHHLGTQRCPHCLRGIYPSRDLRAIHDFASQPWPGTLDVPTWVTPIKYSEVLRRLGRELVAIEAERLSRCADLDLRAKELRRHMRQARVDTRSLNRAARVAVGYEDERAKLGELGRRYLSVIEDDKIEW